MPNDLLLLSSSHVYGKGYLEHAAEAVRDFFGTARVVHFAPYALHDQDAYTAATQAALAPFGIEVVGLHREAEPRRTLEAAEVLYVGGGNSFRLARAIQRLGLLEVVRRRVASGALRYLGASAGTNMACPTLRTTNDMPIVAPASFETFGLIPFQVNPHFQDADPASTHMGETRERRIAEFLEENDVAVLAMREGAWLRRRDRSLRVHGTGGALLFQRAAAPRACGDGEDLSDLLDVTPRFDLPV